MNIFDRILQEVLENVIMKTKLFEMVYDRQKALDILTLYHDEIAEHFIKVILFPNHRDTEHWIGELENWVTIKVSNIRLKPNNRKLKFDDYYEILFDQPLGHEGAVTNIIKYLVRGKRIPSIQGVDYEEVRLRLKTIYEELCDDLSIDNYDGIEKYIEMLKEK